MQSRDLVSWGSKGLAILSPHTHERATENSLYLSLVRQCLNRIHISWFSSLLDHLLWWEWTHEPLFRTEEPQSLSRKLEKMAFLSTGAPRVISSWSLRKMSFRGWLCPRLASFLTSSGSPAVTLSDILNYLMQAKCEAFLRVTRKEIKINLAQRETCFPLRKCCLCKHSHAPLSVSHAMQTLGRADLCGHTPGG